MPLKPGSGSETVSDNIRELHRGKTYAHTRRKFGAGKANKQAVAIALGNARKTESQARHVVDSLLSEGDDEARELQIGREILAELSASDRQTPETTLANIRKLADELVQMHRNLTVDLSAPAMQSTDDGFHIPTRS